MSDIYQEEANKELEKYMYNFSIMLRAMQSRVGKSQDYMGDLLGISRSSFRHYALNIYKKEGGMTLLLLLKVAIHEKISIHRLMEILSGDSPSQMHKGKSLEKWKETILNHFGFINTQVRNRLVKFLKKDKDNEPVFKGHRLTWLLDMLLLIADLPPEKILEIERMVIENSLKRINNLEEKAVFYKRLDAVTREYRNIIQ